MKARSFVGIGITAKGGTLKDVPIPDGQTMRVWLKGLRFPLLLSRHVFTNDDKKQRTLDLISNDLTLTAAEMKAIYHCRRPIEATSR